MWDWQDGSQSQRLDPKSDNLSLISGVHIKVGEKQFLQNCPPVYTLPVVYAHNVHTYQQQEMTDLDMRKEFWTSLTFKQITMKLLFAETMKKGEFRKESKHRKYAYLKQN